jgi:predicted MPP superfamily phosphohydrolase
MSLFFLVWIALIGLAHWYIGRRVIHSAAWKGTRKRLAWTTVVLVFFSLLMPFIFFANRSQSASLDVLAWIGYVVMGFVSLLFSFLLLRDLTLLLRRVYDGVSHFFRKATGSDTSSIDKDRRRFLTHATNIAAIGLAASASGFGFCEARRRATIESVDVALPNLPPSFEGTRIVQFTDLHVGPTIKRNFVERVAEQIAELSPDMIVFTGDLVDGTVSWLQDDVAPLRELRAPLGKYFVTGNHEYYSGANAWVDEARRLDFDVLMNEHRIIQKGSNGIILAGITDYSGGDFLPSHRSNPAAAFAGAPRGMTRILLAHQPRSIFVAMAERPDLQISGHTHGGQFFPWNHLATLNQPYIKGLHRHYTAQIYVSRGTGYWGPPVRLGIPPEITLITLRRTVA